MSPQLCRTLVFIYLGVLFVLHQDFWLADDPSLIFGFIPIGLGYHILFSILAAFGWFLAIRFAWPKELDEEEEKERGRGGPVK